MPSDTSSTRHCSVPHLSVIIKLEPGDPQCVGYVPSRDRRCLFTNAFRRQVVTDLLESGTTTLHAGKCIDATLELLAHNVLCGTHRNQNNELVNHWKEQVRPYVQNHPRSSIRSERPLVSHTRPSPVKRPFLPPLSNIIKLDLEKDETCAGYAPSKGRPCLNGLGELNWRFAIHLLVVGTTYLRARECTDRILEELAQRVLCRFHKNQAPDLVARWKARIQPFILQPSILTRHLTSQRTPLDQPLDAISEIGNVLPEDSFALTASGRFTDWESLRSPSSLNLRHRSSSPLANSDSTGEASHRSLSSLDTGMETALEEASSQAGSSGSSEPSSETTEHPSSNLNSEVENSWEPTSYQVVPSDYLESASETSDRSSPSLNVEDLSLSREASDHSEFTSSTSSRSSSVSRTARRFFRRLLPNHPAYTADISENSTSYSGEVALRQPIEGKCGICLELLQETGMTYCKSRCGSNFHVSCLQQWLKFAPRSTCPMCRGPWTN